MKRTALLLYSLLLVQYSVFAQNVGIGTTAPVSRLHVRGTGGGNQIVLEESGGTVLRISNEATAIGAYIGTTSNHSLTLVANNSGRMTVAGNGNIGIGQPNPAAPLQFANSAGNKIAFFQNGSNFYGIGTQASLLQFYTPGSIDDIAFGYGNSTAFTETMRIKGNGAVGIGTTTPNSTALLEMNSTNKGLLIPRMTSAQREAITNPATGLMVFDLQYKKIFMFDGTEWLPLTTGSKESLPGGPQTPGDNTANSQFGFVTGMDSLWAIAGAPFQNNSVGAAYIYQKQNQEWVEAAKLVPDDGIQQYFGGSVSVDYPYAVVGAPGHNLFTGCVYVFFHNGTNWVQVSKFFKPVNNVPFNYFGNSVDIEGANIVAGCPGADDLAYNGGAAYTYRLNTGTWQYNHALSLAGLDSNNYMGYAVAIANTKIAVGVPGDGWTAAGRFAGQRNAAIGFTRERSTGAISTYNLSSGVWNFANKITSSSTQTTNIIGLGTSLDMHYSPGVYNNYIIVSGAPSSENDNQSTGGTEIGAVLIYASRSATLFAEVGMLIPQDNSIQFPATGYQYGQSVAVDHTSATSENFPGTQISVSVGIPGMNNNKGAIEKIYLANQIDIPFSANNFAFRRLGYTNGNNNNSQLGSSISVFGNTNSIAGAPGTGNNKGAVIFGF